MDSLEVANLGLSQRKRAVSHDISSSSMVKHCTGLNQTTEPSKKKEAKTTDVTSISDRYNNFYGNWHEEKNTERSPQTKEVSDFPGLFPAEYNDYVENYANVPSNVFVFPIGNFRIVLSKNMQQKNGKSRRVQTVQYPRETNEVTLIRNRTTKAEHILVTILCDSWHTNLKHQNTHAVVLHGKTSTGEVKYYCGNVMQDFKNKTAQEYKRYELIRKCIGYVLRFFRFPFKTLIPQFKKKAPPLFEGCSLYLFYLIDLLKVENDTHFPEDGNRNVLRIKAGEIMKALVLGTPDFFIKKRDVANWERMRWGRKIANTREC